MLNFGYNISILLVAVFLWFFPYTASKILTGSSLREQEVQPSITAEQMSSIMFVVLGAFLLFNVVSDIGYWIFLTQSAEAQSDLFTLTIENKASMFATGLEAALAICLFFGRKGFLKTLVKLRQ
jgi:hypothetical protein